MRGQAHGGAHDLRASSPTDGQTLVTEIGEHDHRGVYIPPGIAHGFYALTDMTITYLVDQYYNPTDELGVAWDDPELQIVWPSDDPELSQRDRTNPRRAAIRSELCPQ